MTAARRLLAVPLLAGLLAAASPGARAEALDEIAQTVAAYPLVRAEFVQEKRMAAMKRPLVTRGRLVFSRTHGVLWQIESPYRMTYVLNETRLVEIAADGARRTREAREAPGFERVDRVFRAMLGANPEALREHFDAAGRIDAGRWTLDLKPRGPAAQFIESMRLAGGRFVERIEIEEAGGDAAAIDFLHPQGAQAPAEDEERLFREADDGSPGREGKGAT
ncbi:MAG: outer membrane lipoprotein carrier protein LolA [Candidatus Accumulibacter sp.]|jgi:hypothetical protein|nr:outer membrane lipoprotein carrier protein LolA [Accumulibacter sp.]